MQENSVITNGYPSLQELQAAKGWPSEERFSAGPVAVIECVQEIPCNPCESACPHHALFVGSPITNLPALRAEQCIGCGICVAKCPGQAIFVVDKTYSETESTVAFPYEYLPLPKTGDAVKALNRAGEYVCDAKVVRVLASKGNDHTAVITIAIPKRYADAVRSMQRSAAVSDIEPVQAEYDATLPDDYIVCRCEEITAGEIRRVITEYGATTVNEVRRRSRAGMGLCQGRTCGKLVTRILHEMLGTPLSELEPATARPPVRPITFAEMAGGKKDV